MQAVNGRAGEEVQQVWVCTGGRVGLGVEALCVGLMRGCQGLRLPVHGRSCGSGVCGQQMLCPHSMT